MTPENLRNALLAQESHSPELKSRYEKEIRKIMEKELPAWQRVCWALSGIVGLSFVVLFGYMAFTLPEEIPTAARLGLAVGALFGAGWTALAGHLVYTGKMKFKAHQGTAAALIWIMVVFMVTMDMLIAGQMEDAAKGNFMVLSGMVFLIFGVVFLLQHNLKQSEMSLRESLLRVEMQLAELNEKIAK